MRVCHLWEGRAEEEKGGVGLFPPKLENEKWKKWSKARVKRQGGGGGGEEKYCRETSPKARSGSQTSTGPGLASNSKVQLDFTRHYFGFWTTATIVEIGALGRTLL